ncbi:MAG: hypothetical protein GY913_05735 [Proteobacteria bacterium]|nr:hypothetical protein [Pseudomonadota bacterium]MCP4916405.1 hypothetical protein [Pseudomonadota bacterium]
MIWLLACAPSPEAADEAGAFLVSSVAELHVELVQFQQDGSDPSAAAFVGILATEGDTDAPFNAVLRVSGEPCGTGAVTADLAIGGLMDGGSEGPWDTTFSALGELTTVGCPEGRARGDFSAEVESTVDADTIEVFATGEFGGTAWTVESSDEAWLP